MSDIRIHGQRAIEELQAQKDRCAAYAEDLRIARRRIEELEQLVSDLRQAAQVQSGNYQRLLALKDALEMELEQEYERVREKLNG